MPTYSETRHVPYSCEQMFDLAADVENYPDFLPWVVATRIRSREGNTLRADMLVGFKMIREKFTTEAVFDRPGAIDITYHHGPFKYLVSHWRFHPEGEGGCEVDFHIDFEFKSMVLRKLMGAVFTEAVHMMVGAFERRARQLYGQSG